MLTTGGNNSSTTFSGVIQDGVGTFGLIKAGSGTFTLAGTNTYTGATTVNAGALNVTGSIASSVLTTVNANATLTGTGAVGATKINTGGVFAPGNGTPGSSMTVASLVLASGAQYMVQVNPATSSFATVTGTATLGGASVNATFANGSYISKQYTILTVGSRNGTFGSLVNTNLPTNFTTSLSYDPTHAFLKLSLNFVPPTGPSFGSGLNINQQAVANTLVNFFNTTGGIPMAFGTLSPSGLTQVAGEAATGSQQTTFNAMGQFMGLMTDPFVAGRGDGPNAGGGANGYADEANAYAAKRKPSDALAAIYTKAPAPVQSFEARWSTWIAGYGGSQTTDGNAVLGSNNTTSSVYGTAVGADYRFSPDTIGGFSLAGGGTNFNVVGSGYGRSDLFQAGAFIRHTVGAAYISGALAYGWQDITTDRIVTAAGADHLRAEFNAQRILRDASRAAIAISRRSPAGSASRLMRQASSRRSTCRPMPRVLCPGQGPLHSPMAPETSPMRAANSASVPTNPLRCRLRSSPCAAASPGRMTSIRIARSARPSRHSRVRRSWSTAPVRPPTPR